MPQMHISRYLLNDHSVFISNVPKTYFLSNRTHIFPKKPIFEIYKSWALWINCDENRRCSWGSTPQMHISSNVFNGHIAFIFNMPKTYFLGTKTHIYQKKPIFEKYKSWALRINFDENHCCFRRSMPQMHISRNVLNGHIAFISNVPKTFLFRQENPYFPEMIYENTKF